MEILKRIIILIAFALPLSAQIVIEEVGVDSSKGRSVTIGSDSIVGSKKVWRAAFLSLAVPGFGQYYLEEKKKGTAYFSADLILLGGSFFSEASSRRLYKNSINYAKNNALTSSTRDRKDVYWNDIGFGDSLITSIDDWNSELAKGREFGRMYEGSTAYEKDYWSWLSISSKLSYIDQRDRAEKWHTASYIFLGGMLVNRIVSFVDGRVSANRYNSNLFSTIAIEPHYSFARDAGGVTVYGSF